MVKLDVDPCRGFEATGNSDGNHVGCFARFVVVKNQLVIALSEAGDDSSLNGIPIPRHPAIPCED